MAPKTKKPQPKQQQMPMKGKMPMKKGKKQMPPKGNGC